MPREFLDGSAVAAQAIGHGSTAHMTHSLMTSASSVIERVAAVAQWEQHMWAEAEKKEYILFQYKDMWNWIVFTIVFFVLITFDNCCLHRGNKPIGFFRACIYTIFWILLAVGFAVYIFLVRGTNDAFTWGVGYLLEWMLSVDNLFVFHLVFKIYGVPDHLKHKPLFYGIVGAVVFRMIFFCLEAALLHSLWWMHFVFGAFLIYTGIKSAMVDDDDDDPRDNWLVNFLSARTPMINGYDNDGAFFVKVKVDQHGNAILPPPAYTQEIQGDAESDADTERRDRAKERVNIYSSDQWYSTPRYNGTSSGSNEPRYTYEWRATLLLLVVVCLEATDIIFAVDSVSAIIAEIPDLYLAYTAAVFAMLGLRAMFFVIETMIDLFEYLKYGVAAVLVFIGVKLMLKGWFHMPPWIMLIILLGTLACSMLASVIKTAVMKQIGKKA
jgi:tellurite resistance protein TerC